jgi:hypothetical protein
MCILFQLTCLPSAFRETSGQESKFHHLSIVKTKCFLFAQCLAQEKKNSPKSHLHRVFYRGTWQSRMFARVSDNMHFANRMALGKVVVSGSEF